MVDFHGFFNAADKYKESAGLKPYALFLLLYDYKSGLEIPPTSYKDTYRDWKSLLQALFTSI
ncbi:MAG: hypothetical protein WCS37_05090, partial [Chloroflexota bacterium]